MSSGFRFWYLSALPENVDFPLRNFNFYRFLCFSFYFLKSQLCVSLLSHLPLLPPFRCFSTFDLYFLTSFCYSMREGEDEPHNRHDSLKHIPMIHIFPLIHSNISIAIILHLSIRKEQLWSYWHLAPLSIFYILGIFSFLTTAASFLVLLSRQKSFLSNTKRLWISLVLRLQCSHLSYVFSLYYLSYTPTNVKFVFHMAAYQQKKLL